MWFSGFGKFRQIGSLNASLVDVVKPFISEKVSKAHIFIYDPVHGQSILPGSHIKIDFLSPLPVSARAFLRIRSEGRFASYPIRLGETVQLPPNLPAGRHAIQVIVSKKRVKWVSQLLDVIIDPDASVSPSKGSRIYCAAPWVQMNVGKANASPCCNFVRKFRNPYRDDVEDYDPWNSKTMQAVRRALVSGDSKFCHSGCGALKLSRDLGLERIRKLGPSPEVEKSFLRGDEVLDHGATRVKITVNHFCNHACLFCSRDVRSSWKANEAMFDLLRHHLGTVRKIALTGGEPLVFIDEVRERLGEFAGSLSGKTLEITTNGSLIEKCIDFLSEVDDLVMNISLNAGTRETYKAVHRKDHFDKVISGIRLLQERRVGRKLHIRLKLVLMKQNRLDVPAYVELAKSLKVDHVKFTSALLYDRADMTAADQLRAGTMEWGEVLRDLKNAEEELGRAGIQGTYCGPGWKRDDSDPMDLDQE